MKRDIISYFRRIYPRKKDSHKGDYGKVFILAGSPGMTGAACLSALAVFRAGSGLVYLGIPKSLNDIVESKLTEVITVPLPETEQKTLSVKSFKKIESIVNNCDVFLIGPGLGRNDSTQNLIRRIILEIDKPIVLDADGINAFESKIELLNKRRTKSLILTPHLGEFSRLLNTLVRKIKENRRSFAKDFAREFNLTLVLKGYRTVVLSRDRDIYTNNTGNPGMATAGSGDVLSGLIAGLKAQGLSDFEASCLGVYIHGKAGDIAARKYTEISMIAGDILEYIPFALKELIKQI